MITRIGIGAGMLMAWHSVCALAGVVNVSAAQAATPKVIVSTANPIRGIATSSSSLVWRQERGSGQSGCADWVRRRSWRTHAVSDVYRCSFKDTLGGGYDGWYGDLAMGTSRVAFTIVTDEFNCCLDFIHVDLASPPFGFPDGTVHTLTCGGDQIVNLAARAGLAAYTRSAWSPTDPNTDCFQGGLSGPGDTLTGGPVDTLNLARGGPPRALAGAPPAAFIGLSAQRLAIVPYDLALAPPNAFPQPLPQIQIWNLGSRTHERTITETGTIEALDMTGDQVAVLVSDGTGALRIDRFFADSGTSAGSTPVPSATAPMLAIYYRFIAYVVGTHVMALDTTTGRTYTVASPTYTPHQILAVRGNVVWSAGAHGWGRVLTARLP